MGSLALYAEQKDNNFKLIRFLAASMVAFSHSYPISMGHELKEPFKVLLGYTGGSIAVDIFFVTSGFLVTKSIFTQNAIVGYFKNRFLRIFPALYLATFFCSMVVGPFLSEKKVLVYLLSLSVYKYIVKTSVLIFGIATGLPGVFVHNPYPLAVNGSLWSLPYEIYMYFFLAGIYLISAKFSRKTAFVCVGLCLIGIHWASYYKFLQLQYGLRILLRLAALFFGGGSLYYVIRSRIDINCYGVVVAGAALIISVGHQLFYIVYFLSLPYLIFSAAYLIEGGIRYYNKAGDYSFGIYIFSFPIQQSFMAVWNDLCPLALFALTFPVALCISIASWHLIEEPALRLKRIPLRIKISRLLKYAKSTPL